MSNTERDKVRAKIKALLAKTTDSGCTKDEALNAAEKAAELMEHYDIQASELDYKDAVCINKSTKQRKYGRQRLTTIITAIAQLTDTKTWSTNHEGIVTFFGFEADVDVACYLFDTLSDAILFELDQYKKSDEYINLTSNGYYHGRTLTTSFIHGIEERIFERIIELANQKHENVEEATGTALVLVKEAKVKEDFDDLGLRLRSVTRYRTVGSDIARNTGSAAGDRLNIGTGVGETRRGQLK